MKLPTILILLLTIHAARSMSLDLGNFFQKQQSGPQTRQAAPLGDTPPEPKIQYEYPPQYPPSESYSEYRSESDPYSYGSLSSDQDSWNSSYEFTGNSSEPMMMMDSQPEDQNNNTSSNTTQITTTSSTVKEQHSISTGVVKSTSSETSSSEVVWDKVTSSPSVPPSTTVGAVVVASSAAANATWDEESEKVVLATAETPAKVDLKSLFHKSIEWAKDDYILSILVPVAAGVIFAVTVICTVALCRCCRKCCRRRRFRKKCLPDSVKNLSTSDRKRLLGDMSSDDEF